jgi:uncharacterized damage-inducible protein DinB
MHRLPALLLVAALFAAPVCPMHAQMGKAEAVPAGNLMAPSKALDDMLSAVEGDIVPAAKAMPADKYDFAPGASTFSSGSPAQFATVRTFAKQVAHLAQANYYFFGAATGTKPEADVKAIASMTSKADLVAALERSFVFAHGAVKFITPANAFEEVRPVDGQHTRFTIAAFGVAHANDHYGQMVEYLRMNGIIPPASAK